MPLYSWKDAGFALYIHWPFCQAKCPYCDFNSYVVRHIDQNAWCTALLQSMARMAGLTPARTLKSIFFGGGTPSLMPVRTVEMLINAAQTHWYFSNDIEITLEANPTSVEAQRFQGYANAGVNRLSMGVQALNDTDLQRLGRMHTAQEAIEAFDIARKYFPRVSFDLIYARTDQTVTAWEKELQQALSMAVDHISAYQLTIEQGTRFGDLYNRGKLVVLPDNIAARMYEVTQDICDAAGMPAYEVSNHAHPEAQSKHNTVYWEYGEYAGIGPGAHSRLLVEGKRYAYATQHDPTQWLATANGPINLIEEISPHEQATEYLMMSMRLAKGASLEAYERLGGTDFDPQTIKYLSREGFISVQGDTIKSTPKGRIVLNSVLNELLK